MKRFIDLVLALFILVTGFPLFIFIALCIYFEDGRPIFFRQVRPGFKEKPFTIIKFRTMKEDENIDVSNDCNRITTVGKFLRKTSLDELPEIWNIFKGEMSFVGPRPLLAEYLDLYSTEHSVRHSVKPGITGWAQINGRNNIDWNQKLSLDIWYIQNRTLLLDIRIIFLTVIKVIQRKDVNKEGFSTSDKFKGYEK